MPHDATAARAAYSAKFQSEEEQSQHFQAMARRAQAIRKGGLILSPEEAQGLAQAYSLLARVAKRAEQAQRRRADAEAPAAVEGGRGDA